MKKLVIAVFVCAFPAMAALPMQMKPNVAHRDVQKANVHTDSRGAGENQRGGDRAPSHENAVNRLGSQNRGVPGAPRANPGDA